MSGTTILIFCLAVINLILLTAFIREKFNKKKVKIDLQKKFIRESINLLESDKKMIAMELHDNIQAKLFSAILKYEKEYENQYKSEELTQLLVSITYDIKSLTKSLRPAKMEKEAFSDLLRKYIIEILPLSVNADIQICDVDFEPQFSINIFRIFQEALTNVLKHSNCENVKITLNFNDNFLSGAVIDDGVGFNLIEKLNSYGILNMKERIHILDGSIEIKSEIMNGTRINFKIPASSLVLKN